MIRTQSSSMTRFERFASRIVRRGNSLNSETFLTTHLRLAYAEKQTAQGAIIFCVLKISEARYGQ